MKYVPTDTFGPFAGSIGSITYSKNKGGHYRKLKALPTNPQTVYQVFQRALLSGFSSLWSSTLTDAQRASWRAATIDYPYTDSLAHTYFLSCSQLFATLGINSIMIGEIPNFSAPVFQGSAAILGFFPAVVGATSVEFDYSAIQSSPSPSHFLAWGTSSFSAGISNYTNRLRNFTFIPDTAILPIDVTAAYVLRFGSVPPTGAKQGWGVSPINSETGNSGIRVLSTTIAS